MNTEGDEAWLNRWRKDNQKALIHTALYKDYEELRQRHQWDLVRSHLRERYGDKVLERVRFVQQV